MKSTILKRWLAVCVATLATLGSLSSCGGDDKPDWYEVTLTESFMPVSIVADKVSDPELLQTCREWNQRTVVVRSLSELPDDPIGFSPAYSSFSYNYSSLILTYRTHTWSIDTYSNRFVRNNVENTYDWYLNVGSSDFDNDGSQTVTLTRFAIAVPKLPNKADVRVLWSLSNTGWAGGWD